MRRIVGLQYRNVCLSNNEANPPKLKVHADGKFSHSWNAKTTDQQHISLSGRFTSAGKAKGTLKIDDQGCTSTAHFHVHTPPECGDGKDNDGDGAIDRGNPPSAGDHGCVSRWYDDSESPDTF